MDKKVIHLVETPCKTMRKSLRLFIAKLCAKNIFIIQNVDNRIFPLTFPTFLALFPTQSLPLIHPYLFHLSTKPTTTTIINIKERINYGN